MTPSTKRTTKFLAAAGVAALLLTGCSSSTDSATPEPEEQAIVGGTAVIGAFSEMPGFDPVKLQNVGSGIERALNVFDTLLQRDDVTGEVHPKLAQSIETDDAQEWVLTLREGVTFTDGTPLDAEAVIFNIERHLAPESASAAKAQLGSLEKMEATGEYEVTFTLTEPSGSFPIALTASSLASLIGSPAALADPETFNTNPVGAGPFVLTDWVRDASISFERNDTYWAEGFPLLDSLEYQLITDNQSRVDTLISGGINLAGINAAQWPGVTNTPGITFHQPLAGGAALIPNASRAPGNDERVREAITLAFDDETTMNVLMGGAALPADGLTCVPFPSGSPACDPELAHTQDLDKASDLIAEFAAEGGDPSMELVYYNTLVDQVTYVQGQLKEIGLNVTLRPVDIAGLSEAQAKGDYGLFWGSIASAGYPTAWNRYYSEGTNWGMVTYPELDAALLQARDAVENDERNAGWRDAQKVIYEESMLRWLLPYTLAMVQTDNLHLGTTEVPYAGSTTVYFDQAWIE